MAGEACGRERAQNAAESKGRRALLPGCKTLQQQSDQVLERPF